MSFDLKIFNGDLAINSNGDVQQIQNSEKLIQDILKILLTPSGSNVFQPGYGSPITGSLIGGAFDENFTTSIAENQVRNAIEALQKLQAAQALRQTVSASEQIAAISNINITRNQTDPRFFIVSVKVIAKDLSIIETQFSIGNSL